MLFFPVTLNLLGRCGRVFLAAILQLVYTGSVFFCMKMLAFGSETCDDSEGRCLGSSMSMGSMAEYRGLGRCVSLFYLSPGCIRGVGLVCVGFWGVFVWFCFRRIAPRFFVRLCQGPMGLLLLLFLLLLRRTTDVWMIVRASSARGMSSNKKRVLRAHMRDFYSQ